MGNPLKEFSHVIDLIVEEPMLIRDNAVESIRQMLNRQLTNRLGKEEYFMKIRVYPHHVIRQNKQAQGAGADRVSRGMSLSFGQPIGRALRLKKGQVLLSLLVNEANIERAKKILLVANSKMSCELSVKVHQDIKSIGTKPIRVREEKVEEKKTEEKAAEGAAPAEAGKDAKTVGADTKGGKGAAPTAGKTDAKTAAKPEAKGKK
jgi:large subunit ribosomal protein L10e